MKKVSGPLRLDLAQFRNLAAYTKLSADELDKASRDQLARGERVTAVLKQRQFMPMSVEKQVCIIYAATRGFLDEVPMSEVERFEAGFHDFIADNHQAVITDMKEGKKKWDEVEAVLKAATEAYLKQFKATLG